MRTLPSPHSITEQSQLGANDNDNTNRLFWKSWATNTNHLFWRSWATDDNTNHSFWRSWDIPVIQKTNNYSMRMRRVPTARRATLKVPTAPGRRCRSGVEMSSRTSPQTQTKQTQHAQCGTLVHYHTHIRVHSSTLIFEYTPLHLVHLYTRT